jgi:tryptophan 2,3-dioxygenase
LQTLIPSRQGPKYSANPERFNNAFQDDKAHAALNAMDQLEKSQTEPSLSDLVQRWLERTPGLEERSVDGTPGFNFWNKYQGVVKALLAKQAKDVQVRATVDSAPRFYNTTH